MRKPQLLIRSESARVDKKQMVVKPAWVRQDYQYETVKQITKELDI